MTLAQLLIRFLRLFSLRYGQRVMPKLRQFSLNYGARVRRPRVPARILHCFPPHLGRADLTLVRSLAQRQVLHAADLLHGEVRRLCAKSRDR